MRLKPNALVGLIAAGLLALAPIAATAAPADGTLVMFVGGLDSGYAAGWDAMVAAFGPLPWTAFSYAGKPYAPYQREQTCQPLGYSEWFLKAQIDALRGRYGHVVLVGHSIGGVLAFDVGSRPDEADFVSKIVTIDAPLLGVHSWERWIGQNALNAGCRVLSDLRYRQLSPYWRPNLSAMAVNDLTRGQQLFVIVNAADSAVDPDEQSIPDVAVNYFWNVADAGLSHSAVLGDADSIQQIAQFITAD